jgi:hypothetical protein
MSGERAKILDKAKKLKELADRGYDGEKDNAKDFLEKYMKKHNIDMSELEGHTINNTVYGNMTDEQFMKEMLTEFLALGLGVLFSKIFKVNFDSKTHFDNLSEKYTEAVKERTNNKR